MSIILKLKYGFNIMWKTHKIDYDAASERKEILTPLRTWMNLMDITASGIPQPLKDKGCRIPFT